MSIYIRQIIRAKISGVDNDVKIDLMHIYM